MKRVVISIVIVLVLTIPLSILLSIATEEEKNEAIIILPGIQGSVLYEPESNTIGWAAEDGDDLIAFLKGLREKVMFFNENGEPANEMSEKLVPPVYDNVIEKWKYAVNLTEIAKIPLVGLSPTVIGGLAKEVEKAYEGSDQTVLVYQYDWRRSNSVEAAKLEKFIKERGFTDVKIIAHSMGGILASQFFARSKANRDICSLYISMGTPYLGSLEMPKYMETSRLPNSFLTLPFGVNFPSTYELLPIERFNKSNQFSSGETALMVDGSYLDYSSTMEFYSSSTKWGVKESGDPKPMFATLPEFSSKMFLENGDHITSLVNSYYMQGIGHSTIVTVCYENGEYVEEKDIRQTKGDGIVPLYSGICGLSETDPRVIIFERDTSIPNDEGSVGHMAFPSQPRIVEKILYLLSTVTG
ncbi:MAG: hypothetical protein LBU04_01235 [Christensenellaceae bacterium]|nr:hypothetical protein [Christensenellaceae bacterium]